MQIADALRDFLLAVLQGLTEFLPVSSSGHLVLVSLLLGNTAIDDSYLIFLHFGTLLATCFYLRKDLLVLMQPFAQGPLGQNSRAIWRALILVSLPTGIMGLTIQNFFYGRVKTPIGVGGFLIITAVLLWRMKSMGQGKKETRELNWKSCFWIGIAQGFAVFPGISRSGSTMAACRSVGLEAGQASRFAFLVSLPPIIGATLSDLWDMNLSAPSFSASYIWGPLVAGVVGFFALIWCIRLFVNGSLHRFWPYCLVVGACAIIWGVSGG